MRGYSVIALNNPKCRANVGGAFRAASVFGASLIIVAGERYKRFPHSPADTPKAWRHIPMIEADHVLDVVPHRCWIVGVEIGVKAISLPEFTHPERALYVFGAEDETLGSEILDRCHHVVTIPTKTSLNLAAAVNVVLYDRLRGGE